MAFVVDGEIIWATDTWIFREIATGTYAGYYLTPLWKPGTTMEENEAVNSLMTYNYNGFDYTAAMEITQENYVATITNFAGLAVNPVNITLEEGRTWIADHPALFTNTNGTYVLYGLEGGNSLIDLTGTGTETTLTFGSTWTGYDSETTYWLGERGAATITLVGDEFVWPGEESVEDITVEGLVTDEDGQPLSDVIVTITTIAEAPAGMMRAAGDTFTGTTDAEGKYTITVTPTDGATYNATFEKEDYETQTLENVDLNNMPTVVLVSTTVNGVFDTNTAKNVVSVKFINAAGQMSSNAFYGINIQVIRYTDGTTKTVKVVK